MKYHTLTAIAFSAIIMLSCSQKTDILRTKVEKLTEGFPGEVGVAVISPNGKSLCVNGGKIAQDRSGQNKDADKEFPLYSVIKFPQALAVCGTLRESDISLKSKMILKPEDLRPDTWSPMREEYPEGGSFSIAKLLKYSLVQSDNNASDILFERICSPGKVSKCIEETGIKGISIKYSEKDMHGDPDLAKENSSTPIAAAKLMRVFHNERNFDEYSRYVWDLMSSCGTGTARIPKYITELTSGIAHKTGSGGVTDDGMVTAVNDVACIMLKGGRHCELAVFIKDASCTPGECEELTALIAKATVESFSAAAGHKARNK